MSTWAKCQNHRWVLFGTHMASAFIFSLWLLIFGWKFKCLTKLSEVKIWNRARHDFQMRKVDCAHLTWNRPREFPPSSWLQVRKNASKRQSFSCFELLRITSRPKCETESLPIFRSRKIKCHEEPPKGSETLSNPLIHRISHAFKENSLRKNKIMHCHNLKIKWWSI